MASFTIKSGGKNITVRYLVVLKTKNANVASASHFNEIWKLASDVVELPSFWAKRQRWADGYIAFAFAHKDAWEKAKELIASNEYARSKVLVACGANNISWHTNS